MGKRRKRVPAERTDMVDQAIDDRLKDLTQSLREQYDEIREEPIPQELQDLVDALRAAEKKAQTRH
ncbi:MAG: hypothetical protein AAF642_08080 [Pseudomonadota bacterium]